MIISKRPAFGLCDSCSSEYGKRRRGHIYRCDRCQPKKPKRPSKRFANQRDEAYQDFVRAFPCRVAGLRGRRTLENGKRVSWLHECQGVKTFAHVNRTRNQGIPDYGHGACLCWKAHQQEEQFKHAEPDFWAFYGLRGDEVRLEYKVAYDASGGAPV